MLGRSAYSGDKYRAAKSAHIGSMDRQLRSLQKRLERVRGRVSTDAAEGADKFGKAIASMLDEVAERFRDGSLSDEAAKIGTEAAKLSDDALRVSPGRSRLGRWWRSQWQSASGFSWDWSANVDLDADE